MLTDPPLELRRLRSNLVIAITKFLDATQAYDNAPETPSHPHDELIAACIRYLIPPCFALRNLLRPLEDRK